MFSRFTAESRRDERPTMKTLVLMVFGQLMSIWGASSNNLEIAGQPKSMDCELARAKCAYRASCARALHSYMVDCADVLAGRTVRCPWACKRALISLTSSEAGYQLSTCNCEDNEFCRRSKERIEVCRPEVSWATAGDTVVSCSVAQWICHADPLCSTALEYYHRFCRSMFHGKKCTPRCNNSLAILDRQEKASKLRNCYCDGTEDFPCDSIRRNTQSLCFGREDWIEPFLIPRSTSDPASGGSSTCADQLLLIVFAIVLMFLAAEQLSCVDGTFPLDGNADCYMKHQFILETDSEESISANQRLAKKSGLTRWWWPWWWTS